MKTQPIIIVATIFLIVFGFAFRCLYGTNDLFTFPFVSTVWGTASDWVMILVTGFTALYLVKSFAEQRRTNDITYSQHRRTIMPEFTINSSIDVHKVRIDGHIILTLEQNELYSLRVSFISDDFLNQSDILPIDMTVNQSITFVENDISLFQFGNSVCATLEFEDSEGNIYRQMLRRSNSSFHLTAPRYIKPQSP